MRFAYLLPLLGLLAACGQPESETPTKSSEPAPSASTSAPSATPALNVADLDFCTLLTSAEIKEVLGVEMTPGDEQALSGVYASWGCDFYDATDGDARLVKVQGTTFKSPEEAASYMTEVLPSMGIVTAEPVEGLGDGALWNGAVYARKGATLFSVRIALPELGATAPKDLTVKLMEKVLLKV